MKEGSNCNHVGDRASILESDTQGIKERLEMARRMLLCFERK